MTSVKRITVNTIATYSRSLLSAGLALFSSRWVLQALGVSDFGLFSLVGSIILFVTFFNSIMSSSASRHFSFELGRNIENDINKWFNTALSIHLILPIILILLGYPIGVYFIKNIFEIPINKIFDSLIILRISLLTAFVSMLSVPFIAMYIAKQKLIELAIIGFIYSVLTFLAAYFLLRIPGNKLIIHTILIATIQIFIYLIQIFRAFIFFPECKINLTYWFHNKRLVELTSFAFWNLFGNFGHLMRTQGLAFLTNIFFGTKGNAAYGISSNLSTQTSNLTNALSASINPEIIQSVGRGDKLNAIKLSFQSAKMGIYLILLLTIPMITEINYVLNLWLTIVPENAEILCILMIFVFMIEKTTLTHMTLLQAINKISMPQLIQGVIFSSSIIVAFIMIKLGFGIVSIGWSIIITMIISRINLIYWVRKYLYVSVKMWVKKILSPYIIIVILLLLLSYSLTIIMQPQFIRLVLNYVINFFIASLLFWNMFFDDNEKEYLKHKAKIIIHANQ